MCILKYKNILFTIIRPDVIILTTELLKRTLYLQNFMKFKSNTAGFTIYKQKGEGKLIFIFYWSCGSNLRVIILESI